MADSSWSPDTSARVCVYVHKLYLDLNQQMEDITEGQRACWAGGRETEATSEREREEVQFKDNGIFYLIGFCF